MARSRRVASINPESDLSAIKARMGILPKMANSARN
jgi:hypothetical protein